MENRDNRDSNSNKKTGGDNAANNEVLPHGYNHGESGYGTGFGSFRSNNENRDSNSRGGDGYSPYSNADEIRITNTVYNRVIAKITTAILNKLNGGSGSSGLSYYVQIFSGILSIIFCICMIYILFGDKKKGRMGRGDDPYKMIEYKITKDPEEIKDFSYESLDAFKYEVMLNKLDVVEKVANKMFKQSRWIKKLSNERLHTILSPPSMTYFLTGPPGTGKTMFARTVARRLSDKLIEHRKEEAKKKLEASKGDNNSNGPINKNDPNNNDPNPVKSSGQGGKPKFGRFGAKGLLPNNNNEPRPGVTTENEIKGGNNEPQPEAKTKKGDKTEKDESRIRMIYITPGDIYDKYVGNTEKKIKKLFEQVRALSYDDTATIIMFDEAEALFRSREELKESSAMSFGSAVSQFLTEIGTHPKVIQPIYLFFATNMKELIDKAIKRRIGVAIPFHNPTKNERKQLINGVFKKITSINMEEKYQDILEFLVDASDGVSHANITKSIMANMDYDFDGEFLSFCTKDAIREFYTSSEKPVPADIEQKLNRYKDVL